MATLHPFRALRPKANRVQQIASVPYDVISVSEARVMADGNPSSFLHVIRPEIDLPEGVDEYDDAVYRKGASNLQAFADSEDWTVEEEASVYVYELTMQGRKQTGVFACVSVDDYDNDVILKHEKTRPVKEDDRTRHIVEQQAHAEPVMLTFKDDARVSRLIAATVTSTAVYEIVTADGIGHRLWRAADSSAFVEAFADVPKLYVADGHHRCKAASRAAEEMRSRTGDQEGEYAYFPAVLFPMADMKILAYNRIVKNLPMGPDTFLQRLADTIGLDKADNPVPDSKGKICLYVAGEWYATELPPTALQGVASSLDVARLGEHILAPILSITDPRRDPNIDFVGGIRGTAELERRVDSGRAAVGISMFPTSIEELVDVSDAGMLMPPKSTWFEPKLRSGLLVHTF